MNLVFVAPFAYTPKATVSARMLPIATSLVRHGHRVTILIPPYDNPSDSDQHWNHQGVDIVNVHARYSQPGSMASLVSQSWQLADRASQLEADIVHVFKPVGPGALAMWLLRFKRDLPTVVDNDDWEGHGGWLDVNPYPLMQKWVMAWQEQWCLGHARAITCASNVLYTRSQSLARHPARLVVLPNGPDHALMRQVNRAQSQRMELRSHFGWGRSPVVIYAGTVPVNHDLDIAVEAVRSALTRWPDLRWVIIAAGAGLKSLQPAIALAGVTPSVEFHDFMPHERLVEYLVAADIAIYPYRDTNINRAKCSGKVIDYMACGLPAVVSDVGMNGDYLDQGRCGILTQPGNAASFTKALEQLLDEPELRAQYGQRAQNRIWQVYGWDDRVTELETLYVSILNP